MEDNGLVHFVVEEATFYAAAHTWQRLVWAFYSKGSSFVLNSLKNTLALTLSLGEFSSMCSDLIFLPPHLARLGSWTFFLPGYIPSLVSSLLSCPFAGAKGQLIGQHSVKPPLPLSTAMRSFCIRSLQVGMELRGLGTREIRRFYNLQGVGCFKLDANTAKDENVGSIRIAFMTEFSLTVIILPRWKRISLTAKAWTSTTNEFGQFLFVQNKVPGMADIWDSRQIGIHEENYWTGVAFVIVEVAFMAAIDDALRRMMPTINESA
eukprot:Gb_40910 [translate_table: standard]